MTYTKKQADIEVSLFSSVETVTSVVLESIVSGSSQLYLEVEGDVDGHCSYVPKNWPNEFPETTWIRTRKPAMGAGTGDPYSEVVWIGYVGHEKHKVAGYDEPTEYAALMAFIMQVDPEEQYLNPNLIENLTVQISYDQGEEWTTILNMHDVAMNGGLNTDMMAFTLQVALARFGAVVSKTTSLPHNKKPYTENYARVVFDSTFYNERNQLWVEDPEERDTANGGIGIPPPLEPVTSGFIWTAYDRVWSGYENFSGYSGWKDDGGSGYFPSSGYQDGYWYSATATVSGYTYISGYGYSSYTYESGYSAYAPGYYQYSGYYSGYSGYWWFDPFKGNTSGYVSAGGETGSSGYLWISGYSGTRYDLWYSGYSGYSGWSGYQGNSTHYDREERFAIHSGNWGVIKSSKKVLASTSVPVWWSQNSTASQFPVEDSPFCYCVNKPHDLMWMGPMGMRTLPSDHPFWSPAQGYPQVYDGGVGACPYGDPHGVHYGMITDYGMWTNIPGEGNPGIGWPHKGVSYFVPDYSYWHMCYSFPYTWWAEPVDGTTIVLMNSEKTEGDVSVAVGQLLGGDETPAYHPYYAIDYVWHFHSGYGGGVYGYYYLGQFIPDPYATSVWSYNAFHQYVISKLKVKANDVAQQFISQWGGIARTQVRGVAKRKANTNDTTFGLKGRDYAILQFNIMGEYEITGRYNNMKTSLRCELSNYATYLDKLLMGDDGSGDPTGGNFYELIGSTDNANHYDVQILPTKSFGKTIYGIKAYREKTGTLQRLQGNGAYKYNQGQYGMQKYVPVVSTDGGVKWQDVTGLTNWTDNVSVQIKPIYLGNNVYMCEHDAKLFKTVDGIGWTPMTAINTSEDTLKEWTGKLDPSLEKDKTFILDAVAPGEFLVAHQYKDMEETVESEEAEIIDKFTIRTKKNSITEVKLITSYNSRGQYIEMKHEYVYDQNFILLKASSALWSVTDQKVYVTYKRKKNEARLFHAVTKLSTGSTPTVDLHYVKEMSFIGNTWDPKGGTSGAGTHWHAVYSFAGGNCNDLYPNDKTYPAALGKLTVEHIVIDQTAINHCVVDEDYSQFVEAAKGTKPYTYTVLNLPRGLTYDSATGQISGKHTGSTRDYPDVPVVVVAEDKNSITKMTGVVAGVVPVDAPVGMSWIYGYVMEYAIHPELGVWLPCKPVNGATIKVREGGKGESGEAGYVEPKNTGTATSNSSGYFWLTISRTTPSIALGSSTEEGFAQFSDPDNEKVKFGYFKTLRFEVTKTGETGAMSATGTFDCPLTYYNIVNAGTTYRVDAVIDTDSNTVNRAIGHGYGMVSKNFALGIKKRVNEGPIGLMAGPADQRTCAGKGSVALDYFFEYSPSNPDNTANGASELYFSYENAYIPLNLVPGSTAVDSSLQEYLNTTGDETTYASYKKLDENGRPTSEYKDLPYGRRIAKVSVTGSPTDKNEDGSTKYTEPKTFICGGLNCMDSQSRSCTSRSATFTAYPVGMTYTHNVPWTSGSTWTSGYMASGYVSGYGWSGYVRYDSGTNAYSGYSSYYITCTEN